MLAGNRLQIGRRRFGILLQKSDADRHRIPDVRLTLRTCTVPGSTLSVPELLEIADTVAASRRLLSYLSERRSKYPRLWDIAVGLTEHVDLEESFQRALDPATETVKDSASPELRRIRRDMENTRSAIRSQVESVLNKLPETVVQDRLITLRGGRFVIPIRENQRHRLEGIVHDQSASGATLFVEPAEAVQLGNEVNGWEAEEARAVLAVLRDLTDQLRPHADLLQAGVEMCVAVDDLYARARYAVEVGGHVPTIADGTSSFCIEAGRHPLLLSDADRPVPFDIEFTDDQFTIVVSGPNAGGKTVLLKGVGLVCALTQAGVVPPVGKRTTLPVFVA